MNGNEAYMIPCGNTSSPEISLNHPICNTPSPGTLYRKNFYAPIIKNEENRRVKRQYAPDDRLNLKMEAARMKLAARFEQEGYQMRTELNRLQMDNSTHAKDILVEIIDRRIDTLWLSSAEDYTVLCVLSYLSSVANYAANNSKSFGLAGNALRAGIKQMLCISIEEFVKQNGSFKERIAAVVDAWDTKTSVLADGIQRLFASACRRLGDSAHRAEVQAELTGIALTGREKYTYVCENSETSCSECRALSGQTFSVSDAEEGVNLPPMHPNCRCTISGYPALPESTTTIDILGLISEGVLQSIIDETAAEVSDAIGGIANVIGAMWSHFIETGLEEYYGTFQTANIGGVEYHINRNSFTAVAVESDGELVVPENAKLYDKQLLE